MPLRRFLQDAAFGPDEIAVLVTAFESTLRVLNLSNTLDPATEMVARTIFELAKQGERDPVRLRERAVQILSDKRPTAANG